MLKHLARAARATGVALLTGLAAGCGGASETEAVTSGDPRVVLGTGEAEYQPLTGEPSLRLVAGIQGGFHAWASFLAYGYTSSTLGMLLATSIEDVPDSRLVMRAELTLHEVVDEHGEPAHTFAGFPAQVYRARCAHGKRVAIEVTFSDDAGGVAGDTRHFIADVEASRRSQSCF